MLGIDFRRWQWLESGLIPLVSAMMRVAWLVPLLHLALNNVFVVPRGVAFPAWLILALLLGASALESALQEHPDAPLISAGVGLLVILAVLGYLFQLDVAHLGRWLTRLFANLTDFRSAFPATFVVVIATALIWRKGLTASWNDYAELFQAFVVGVLVLGLLLLVRSSDAWDQTGINVWGAVVAFVFSSLLALALISAHQTLALERIKDAHVPPVSREWLTVVGLVVAGVIVLGWAAAVLLSPESVKEILRLLSPIWIAIRTVITYIWLAFAYVFFWALGPLLEWLQAGVADNWENATERLAERLEEEMELPEPTEAAGISPALLMALRIIGITVLVVGIALLFYMAYRRRKKRNGTRASDERESVLSGDLLTQQLRDFLASLRRKPAISPFVPLSGEDPRLVVRRLYQSMLRRMSSLGHARAPEVTPRAYARRLEDVLPGEDQAVSTLTEAYMVARYAPEPPTPEQVTNANRAWERIAARLEG
ncbi:MAG: DUF4129 domain-containing protein [Chloroflexi bacterium]|nr:DUF4129 domain-containing protein [Chloroflexota bacterium]